MKYITILFLFLIGTINGQKSYPYLYSDSVGSQFVVLTIEQAQKLDNATEFSPTFWKDVNKYYIHVDSLCKIEIEEKNNIVDSLSLVNKTLNEVTNIMSESISVRDTIIKSKNQIIKKLEGEIILNNEKHENEIKFKDKEIKKKNRDIKYLGGFSIILMIGVVISSIF
jgi:hypothetical protein